MSTLSEQVSQNFLKILIYEYLHISRSTCTPLQFHLLFRFVPLVVLLSDGICREVHSPCLTRIWLCVSLYVMWASQVEQPYTSLASITIEYCDVLQYSWIADILILIVYISFLKIYKMIEDILYWRFRSYVTFSSLTIFKWRWIMFTRNDFDW